jgi:hypothetical protein
MSSGAPAAKFLTRTSMIEGRNARVRRKLRAVVTSLALMLPSTGGSAQCNVLGVPCAPPGSKPPAEIVVLDCDIRRGLTSGTWEIDLANAKARVRSRVFDVKISNTEFYVAYSGNKAADGLDQCYLKVDRYTGRAVESHFNFTLKPPVRAYLDGSCKRVEKKLF